MKIDLILNLHRQPNGFIEICMFFELKEINFSDIWPQLFNFENFFSPICSESGSDSALCRVHHQPF